MTAGSCSEGICSVVLVGVTYTAARGAAGEVGETEPVAPLEDYRAGGLAPCFGPGPVAGPSVVMASAKEGIPLYGSGEFGTGIVPEAVQLGDWGWQLVEGL